MFFFFLTRLTWIHLLQGIIKSGVTVNTVHIPPLQKGVIVASSAGPSASAACESSEREERPLVTGGITTGGDGCPSTAPRFYHIDCKMCSSNPLSLFIHGEILFLTVLPWSAMRSYVCLSVGPDSQDLNIIGIWSFLVNNCRCITSFLCLAIV